MVSYEDTEFRPNPEIEHETCLECGGAGETPGISTACRTDGEPIYQKSSCVCYEGKILTPYEKEMQAAIYRWTNRARASEAKVATWRWTVNKFEKGWLGGRLLCAAFARLPRIEYWELQRQERTEP